MFFFSELYVTFIFLRPDWDGGPHDVHHSFSGDCYFRTQKLETSELGLWLVFYVSVFIKYLNNIKYIL